MLPGIKADGQFYCDLCDKCLNINDKDNHIKGNKHKYHLRQKESKNKDQEVFECTTCKVKLTSQTFYTIHIGSKKHRRKCKEYSFKKRINSEIDETKQVGSNVQHSIKSENNKPSVSECGIWTETNCYKSTKEKYRSNRAKNREEIYQNYLNSLLTYWGVTLALNPKVHDFKISVNNKEWGRFGDVVLEIDYSASDYEQSIRIVNAINLKYISNKTKQFDDINRGKFNLTKLVAHAMVTSPPKKEGISKFSTEASNQGRTLTDEELF
ncbi:uncharacterized protein LOC143191013 [Rhynchophorus ferrugineus]|uniref:uncharacterized protein LOC143191013 n=1 Tax=Rhynchophorus ferrugineus TaxID=354439 RepID=UPI003FCC792A